MNTRLRVAKQLHTDVMVSPSIDEVLAAVSDAQASRGSRPSEGYPLLVAAWKSRTACLYRIRVDQDESHDVVAKVLGDGRNAARLARALNELTEILSDDRSGAFLQVPALGFSNAIRCVVMPYVKGTTIRQILEGQAAGADDRAAMLDLVTHCGRMLARYHARYADTSPTELDEAWRDLDFRVKGIFGSATDARNLLNPSVVSRSYADFHPGHVIVVGQRKLALIDPPCEPHYLFVARDIACFIDKMLVTPRSALFAPLRKVSHADLSAAFLRGYDTACTTPLTPGDRVVVDVNLAFLLKRRIRRIVAARRWVKLLYCGGLLVYHYRRVMNRLRTVHSVVPSESSSFFSSTVSQKRMSPLR